MSKTQEPKGPKIVIRIKKVKKRSEGGHGGQWKVAYADFVTALMAFFLLLWLVSMIAPEKRHSVADYFKHFTVFEQSGQAFKDKPGEVSNEAGEVAKKIPDESFYIKPEEFKIAIKKSIEEKLGDIKEQVIVDIFEDGVRIQLVDTEGRPMFDIGSSKPTPLAIRILQVIGDNIKARPNPIAIEGHTDSLTYSHTGYSNWELSTERALTAKKELEKYGLDPAHLTRVAGYADTVSLIKEDPKDLRNRRISIILKF